MKFTPEELAYGYDSLEPFIDQKTMAVHHDKHYVGYVDKLNTTLEKYENLQSQSIEELLKNLDGIPED
ncbi:MAG: superoxide dismutase, partial [Patescibacteria group bacterium]